MPNYRRNANGDFLVTEAEFLADPADVLQKAQQGLKILVESSTSGLLHQNRLAFFKRTFGENQKHELGKSRKTVRSFQQRDS